MKRFILPVFLFASCPFLCGCPLALIAAGVGVAKAGGAKKAEAQTKDREAYSNYRIEMEKLNLEREKAGLQTKDIMAYEEWAAK